MKKTGYIVAVLINTAIFLCLSGLTAAAADSSSSEISVTGEKSALPAILTILGGVVLFIVAGISAYKMISKKKK